MVFVGLVVFAELVVLSGLWFLPSLWFLGELVVFWRDCGFWASLWFFGELVVFWRDCGFWASLWFLGAFHFPSPTDPYYRAHLTRIDEDALEGVCFAFSIILRCLPYFCRKTHPRCSYELLEAFLPSCGERIPHSDTRPTLQHPTSPHLTPHRRGCPRRGLFRVFDHSKVFALLLPKNAS